MNAPINEQTMMNITTNETVDKSKDTENLPHHKKKTKKSSDEYCK